MGYKMIYSAISITKIHSTDIMECLYLPNIILEAGLNNSQKINKDSSRSFHASKEAYNESANKYRIYFQMIRL